MSHDPLVTNNLKTKGFQPVSGGSSIIHQRKFIFRQMADQRHANAVSEDVDSWIETRCPQELMDRSQMELSFSKTSIRPETQLMSFYRFDFFVYLLSFTLNIFGNILYSQVVPARIQIVL